ncbi:MAG: alpha/beta fold hydrolase [Pseudomonadota bacterium]
MATNNGLVLVHGAWHNHRTWDHVVERLEAAGLTAKAIDLPGAGAHAAAPASFAQRPLDPAAFGSEPSPNASVTQEERTQAVIDAVRDVNAQTGGKAVIVGHSLGGLTISPVAEAIPEEISAAVYLCAFMLPPGMVAGQMIGHELMADSKVAGLFMADPEKVGALRIDVQSDDPDYRAKIKQAFCGDLTDAQFEGALAHLHPDEPAQVAGVPSSISIAKFSTVERHYIECTEDRAITLAGQREMVRLVDTAMPNKTIVHTMATSHSPFFSAPDVLAEMLGEIAGA